MGLSTSQQRGAMVLLGILVAILGVRLWLNPRTILDSGTNASPEADQLADKIDPNTATVSELAAIPDLGEKRAAAIIEFRERYLSRHPSGRAFQRLSDLEQISGIGPAIAETMEPYLVFAEYPTSTRS
jgi:competence ComEA-like helix-hairpin-helix protein